MTQLPVMTSVLVMFPTVIDYYDAVTRFPSGGEGFGQGSLLPALKCCDHPTVPDLIEFLILTGARKSEATKAKWSYKDIEDGIWTVFPYLFVLPEIIDKFTRSV
ncbi:MAG TPA: hypothetical protein DCR95_07370 [Desulfobacter sp.]|nr:hypothetical protein [Desulfobacter sp.]